MKQNKVASNLQQNYTEAEKAQARRNIGLADVAHSGDYNDLINKPVPINGQVQSDWNQTNEMMPDFIRNKPSVGNAVLTIRKNGSDVQTFSANSTTDKVANIEVPTKVSELQNDAGYITSSAIPAVNNGTLTIKKNGTTVQTFTANSSSNVTADISVPEYTAGTDVKISNQNAISSLHGLKTYSRTQPTGGYGDMVEDDVVLGIYHISPPTIVNNDKKNNIVYEYKVTDITNVSYFDIGYAMTPDADGFVPNVHFIIDLTGEITDDSDPGLIGSPHDWLTLNVGYGSTKAQLANYSARWIPIYIGHKYLVDFYGNVAHVSVLGENRVQDIASNFGDVHEYLSTDPNTTHHDITYKLERSTVYHMDILTNGLQAENTDKYTYRIGLGIYGAQNIRYLTGWNRQDSGQSIHQHLDFTSDIYRTIFIEFDQAQYPMATQTVNLMIVGTKERL